LESPNTRGTKKGAAVVHQATVVGVARDERGSIILRAAIPTEARAILQLVLLEHRLYFVD